ncbi:CheR family methyltransferase [Bacillus atrophaeus]|uniref:CheR family methyltransferase n=1 Tax=Bacillus atrophaeus TaxID=1452 RepID=UPI0038732A06
MQEELMEVSPIDIAKQKPAIIGIGASAGGLNAVKEFFKAFKSSLNVCFVVVQHLSAKYKSFMPELLGKYTSMDVRLARNGETLKGKTVYLCPPNHNIKIENHTIQVHTYDENEKINYPIDYFLKSLALSQREKAIAIILSGKGRDGAEGMKLIHEHGGICMAQDESAQCPDMPNHVIKSGIADFVERPKKIAAYMNQLLNQVKCKLSDEAIEQTVYLIQKQTGIDFSMYKKNSVSRRIERRMNLLDEQMLSLDEYNRYVMKHPEELQLLFNDLLIGVTHFFRDKESFDTLRKHFVPAIVENNIKKGRKSCRVWVAGCSTGEEAYSVAMVFCEEIEKRKAAIDLQIFATDINKSSIQKASKGTYTEQAVSPVPPEWLVKYFEKKGPNYVVKKRLREHVVFAPHNVIKDSPFVDLDFISCRNVMIYFQQEFQEKVLSLFYFALREEGYLMLGPSETIGKMTNLYTPADRKWKVFSNSGSAEQIKYHLSEAAHAERKHEQEEKCNKIYELMGFHQMDEMYLSLIDQYLQPCMILNDREEIIASSESANQYLKFPNGKRNYSIYNIFPANLSVPISTALKKARATNTEVKFQNMKVSVGGKPAHVELTLKSLKRNHYQLYILFIENKKYKREKSAKHELLMFDEDSAYHQRILDLEKELYETKQHLQTAIEELETSNEELQSTNEELIAANEELQSTNEEMQSVNEELMTVNQQFEKKIEELTAMTTDMDNLLINTNIATIFLDEQCHIKLFTPEAQNVFHLIEKDVGRPIYHISSRLKYENYFEDIQLTLKDKRFIQKEVEAQNGDWYNVKMMPYYTNEYKVEGVVITFVNITDLKSTNKALQISSEAVEQSPANILIAAADGQIKYVNKRFCEMIGKEQYEIIGENVFELYDQYFQLSELSSHWHSIPENNRWSGELYYQDKDGLDRWEYVTLLPVKDDSGQVGRIMRIAEDITNQKQSEKMLMKSEMLSAIGQLAAGIAHEIRNPLTSLKGFLQLMIQSKKYQKDYAEVMMSEFVRLESIINEFLVLSRSKSVQFETIQINDIVEDVSLILESQAMLKGVRVIKNLNDKLPDIKGVPNELKQVFLNVLKNAIESMEQIEGDIHIHTVYQNGYIQLTFEDQGKGISKEMMERLGEPFYTTKEKGTGLGLMVSFKIIESHKGTIEFESIENQGTKVTIKLPVSKK